MVSRAILDLKSFENVIQKKPEQAKAMQLVSMQNPRCSDSNFSASFYESLATYKEVIVLLMDEPNWLNLIDPDTWNNMQNCAELEAICSCLLYEMTQTERDKVWQKLETKGLFNILPGEICEQLTKENYATLTTEKKISITQKAAKNYIAENKKKFTDQALTDRDNWWQQNEGVFTALFPQELLKKNNYFLQQDVPTKINTLNKLAAQEGKRFHIHTWASWQAVLKNTNTHNNKEFLNYTKEAIEKTAIDFVKRNQPSNGRQTPLRERSEIFLKTETFKMGIGMKEFALDCIVYPNKELPAFTKTREFFGNKWVWVTAEFRELPQKTLSNADYDALITGLQQCKIEELDSYIITWISQQINNDVAFAVASPLVNAAILNCPIFNIEKKLDLLKTMFRFSATPLLTIKIFLTTLKSVNYLEPNEIDKAINVTIKHSINPNNTITQIELNQNWKIKIEKLLFNTELLPKAILGKKLRREIMRDIFGNNFQYSHFKSPPLKQPHQLQTVELINFSNRNSN